MTEPLCAAVWRGCQPSVVQVTPPSATAQKPPVPLQRDFAQVHESGWVPQGLSRQDAVTPCSWGSTIWRQICAPGQSALELQPFVHVSSPHWLTPFTQTAAP